MIDSAARGAWRELTAKLRPFIAARVRLPTDVDDVLQEVFLRMQRGLAGLRDDERFGPWVYQVARNAVADHHRATARYRRSMDEAVTSYEEAIDEDPDEEGRQDLAAYVALFVSLLPSPYREALTLTEVEGMSQKDAAVMLGLSISGMKSRVQRGRQQLRVALEECCHFVLDVRGHVIECEQRADGKLPDGCCRSIEGKSPSEGRSAKSAR